MKKPSSTSEARTLWVQAHPPSRPFDRKTALCPEVLCSGGLLLLRHHRSYDLSCHARTSPFDFPCWLYGWPCHTGAYWLTPRLPPFTTVPSQRAMLSDPGEPDGCSCPALLRRLQPSPANNGLGTPSNPPSAVRWGHFEAPSHGPLTCWPSVQIRPGISPGRQDLYSGAFA